MVWLKTLNISKRTFNAVLSVIFVSFSTPRSVLTHPGPANRYCFALPVTPQTSKPQLRPLAKAEALKKVCDGLCGSSVWIAPICVG